MTLPAEDAVPFTVLDGWPERLRGCVVSLRESGITLGSLMLEDDEWASLRTSRIVSVRIDDHRKFDGWTTRGPDGSESQVEFEIPTSPVPVPASVLVSDADLLEWVGQTHGALGRLLLWDASQRWWLVQEPDLELLVICAPPGMFRAGSDHLSWWDLGTDSGRAESARLRERFSIEGGV
jgi:hypothetical protein